jgi:hypothetical protein
MYSNTIFQAGKTLILYKLRNKVIHNITTLQYVETKKNITLNNLENNGTIICVNCTQAIYQNYKLDKKNKELLYSLNIIRKTSSYSWKHNRANGIIQSQFVLFEKDSKYHSLLSDDLNYNKKNLHVIVYF